MRIRNNSPRTPGSNAGQKINDTVRLDTDTRAVNSELPPHSDEAEAAALGCVLLAPDNAKAMLAKLGRSDFFDVRHKEIFAAVVGLASEESTPDVLTLFQRLKDKGRLEDAGGMEYLQRLPDLAPSAANFTTYLATLKDKAQRRRLLEMAERVSQLAHDERNDSCALVGKLRAEFDAAVANDMAHREWFRFHSPADCLSYIPPENLVLIGDFHITRGAVTVIGGFAGVGKSRAAVALAVAGATNSEWLGRKSRCRFRTAILQNENPLYRLKSEFAAVNAPGLDEFIRVTDPPPFGMALDNADFRAALADWFEEWKPDVVIFDPWNSAARDDGQRDYAELYQNLKDTLPKGNAEPALVIVAHNRKPKGDARPVGRGLLHELAGHHVLGTFARSAFTLEAATGDPEDERVVWTCCKNNNGDFGRRSAWYRRNGLFLPCPDFDWPAFDAPEGEGRRTVSTADMEKLFDGGKRPLERKHAAKELEEATKLKRTACYEALKLDGRFADHLKEDPEGLLNWTS